jgi:hypothetical protein
LAAVAAGVLYTGFLCLLYFSQASIIYPGAKNRVDAIPPPSQGAELSRISTALGDVDALFLPAPTVDAARQAVVIFGHGNGEVIDYWVTALDGFRQRGIGVLFGGISRLRTLDRVALRSCDQGSHGRGL